MSEAVVLYATHTHLFAGARLTAGDGRFPADSGRVRIVCRDDAEADAELLPGDADGELDLTVDAHRTAAVTTFPRSGGTSGASIRMPRESRRASSARARRDGARVPQHLRLGLGHESVYFPGPAARVVPAE
jgi:CRP-like cAMP-binding protein